MSEDNFYYALNLDVESLRRDAEKAKREINGLGGAVDKQGKQINDSVRSMGKTIAGIGAGLGAGLAIENIARSMINFSHQFNKSMLEVATISSTVTDNMDDFKKQILDLTTEIPIQADEAAKALYQIVSAGHDGAAGMNILEVASKAAIGGVTETATAADAITTLLNGYKKGSEEAEKMSDQLFTTVRLGKTTFGELGHHIAQAAPIAASFGIETEQMMAAIATLTQSGVPTAQAMTQIRAAILASSKVLGDGYYNTHTFQEGLAEIAAMSGGSQAKLRELIPEIEALNGVLGLTGINADMASAHLEAMQNTTGATQAAFEKMNEDSGAQITLLTNTLKAKFADAAGSVEELGGSIAKYLNEALDSGNLDKFAKSLATLGVAFGAFKATNLAVDTLKKIPGNIKYAEEIAELQKLLDVKNAEHEANVQKLVTEKKITVAQAEKILATRAEIQAKLDSVRASETLALKELDTAKQSDKAARAQLNAAKAELKAKQQTLDAARQSGNAVAIASARKARDTAATNVNTAAEAKNAAAKAAATASSKASALTTQAETLQTGLNTAATNTNSTATKAAGTTKLLFSKAIGSVTKAFKAMKVAMMSNPFGLIAVAVVGLVAVMRNLYQASDRAAEKIGEFMDKQKELKSEAESLSATMTSESSTALDATQAYDNLAKILPNLTKQYSLLEFQMLSTSERSKLMNKALVAQQRENIESEINRLQDEQKKYELMSKAGMLNPAVALYGAYKSYTGSKEIEEAEKAMAEFNTQVLRAKELQAEQTRLSGVDDNIALLTSETSTLKERNAAYEALKTLSPELAKLYDQEALSLMSLAQAQQAAANAEKISELEKRKAIVEARMNLNDQFTGDAKSQSGPFTSTAGSGVLLPKVSDANKLLNAELQDINKAIANLKLDPLDLNVDKDKVVDEAAQAAAESAREARKSFLEEFDNLIDDLNKKADEMSFDMGISELERQAELTDDVNKKLEIQDEIRRRNLEHTLQGLDEEKQAHLDKIDASNLTPEQKEEKKKEVEKEYETLETLTMQQSDSEAEHNAEKNEKEQQEKRLKEYQEYYERRIEIKQWEADRIDEINQLIADKEITEGEGEERIKATQYSAEADIAEAAEENDISEEDESTGVYEQAEDIIRRGADYISTQLGIISEALEATDDPKLKAKYTAQLKTLSKEMKNISSGADSDAKKTGDEIEKKYEGVSKVMSGVNGVVDSIQEAFGDLLGEAANDAIDTAQMVATTSIALADGISKAAQMGANGIKSVEGASVILLIIQLAIQIAMKLIEVFTKYFSQHAKLQFEIDASKERVDALNKSYEESERIQERLHGNNWILEQNRQLANLTQQQREYNKQLAAAEEQLQKATTEDKAEKAQENIDAAQEGLYDTADELQDLYEETIERIGATDLKDFAQSLAESLVDGWEGGLAGMNSAFDETLNDLIKQMLTARLAEKLVSVFEPVFDKFDDYISDSQLTEDEMADFLADIESKKGEATTLSEAMKQVYDNLGLDATEVQQGTANKGFEAMTQDTAEELNGRFTALQIIGANIEQKTGEQSSLAAEALKVQNDIRESMLDMTELAAEQLVELKAINANTSLIGETNNLLRRANQKLDKL